MSRVKCDVIIVGAGAAGLMCAIEAGKRGRSVIVLEHNDSVGKKIRISGGGRCNFTNIHASPQNYISQNPHFCKSALSRYTPADFIRLVQSYKIPFHEKKLGQLFCDSSAQEIIDMLLSECRKHGVKIVLNARVKHISKSDRFVVQTDMQTFESSSVVIASGGLSIPKIGATGFAYDVARQFGLKIVPTRPGLVPLTWDSQDAARFSTLSGISLNSRIACGKKFFEENFLFTHRGLSGPAILQISSYWKSGDSLEIRLLPEHNIMQIIDLGKKSGKKMANFLKDYFPERFLEVALPSDARDVSIAHCPKKTMDALIQSLTAWNICPRGTEGYEKAEVTIGGVDTDELSSQTMEVKKVPGLYVIGEAVDVTGHLGGYNFQWAWASGHAAGQAV